MWDIVLPKDNELELIRMAEKLGWQELCLAYTEIKDISRFKNSTDMKLFSGILVEPGKEQRFVGKADLILARTSDAAIARSLAEKGDVDVVFGLEGSSRPDFMHHRNSGLNHIICKLFAERDIQIVFDFSVLLKSFDKDEAVILGRMAQNFRFARKYKIDTFVASFAHTVFEMRSVKQFQSLLQLLS